MPPLPTLLCSQEEVAVWGAYFNATSPDPAFGELSARTTDAILAFMPSQPVYALHGAAYGMGDVTNNAKWMTGWEREGGHYRAGLNSVPLVERFRAHPDDLYLLHVGLGGVTNVLPNVDETGAPSMCFHTNPWIMDQDPNSGDWGLAFFGSTQGAGGYLVNNSVLGWTCHLCDAIAAPAAGGAASSPVTVVPRDTFHARVYVEPLGLDLRAWAGAFSNVTVDFTSRTVTVNLEAPGSPSAIAAHNAELARAAPRPSEGVLAVPFAASASPFDSFRVSVDAAAPAARPFTFSLVSPSSATLVRGAWQWPVTDPTQPGTAVFSWA
jgi:hypothetical protein